MRLYRLGARERRYEENKHNSEETPEQCAWQVQDGHTVEGNYIASCRNLSAKLKWTMGSN